MSFKKLTVIGCIVFLGVLAVIVIVLKRLDAGALAHSLAATVKANTGRELRIGNATIELLPAPMIVLSDVRFANADWGTQPWLAEAKSVTAAVDLERLMVGNIRIKYLEVEGANVLLETDSNGTGNWTTPGTDSNAPPSVDVFDVDRLTIGSVAFAYRNGVTGETTRATIASAQFDSVSTANRIRVSVLADYNGKQVAATGTMGPLAALFTNQRKYPVEFKVTVGAASVSVQGTIEEPHGLRGLDMQLGARIPEIADYVAQTGAAVPPLGAFHGAAHLTGTLAAPVFSAIDVKVGDDERSKLTIRGEIDGALQTGVYIWQSSGLDLIVEGAQFGDLSQWYARPLPALGAYRIVARMSGVAASPKVDALDATFGGAERPEVKLRGAIGNLRAASGIDLHITASADKWWRSVVFPAAPPLPPFRASARVRDIRNGYRVDNLNLKIGDNVVAASIDVTSSGARPRIRGHVTSPLIDLSRIAQVHSAAPPQGKSATVAKNVSDNWKLADLDLDLKIGRLILPDGRQLQSASGRLALDDGRIKATALQMALANSQIKLDGIIADPGKIAGLDLKLGLQGAELAELLKLLDRKSVPVGPFQGRARVTGSLEKFALSDIDATVGRPGQSMRVAGRIEDVRNFAGIELAITASLNDSVVAGKWFNTDVPRLPPLRITTRVTRPQSGYLLDALKLTLGRSSLEGRVSYIVGEARPHITTTLSGSLLDLSELASLQPKRDAPNPLLAADVDAELRLSRVILADRRTLGPVSGSMRLNGGKIEVKQLSVALEGASAIFDGRINDPIKPAQIELAFNGKFANTAGLAAFTRLRMPDLPAFTASGKLADVPNGYTVTGLKFSGATMTLAGDVSLVQGARLYKVSARTTSPSLDLSGLIALPADGAPKTAAVKERVIPDFPLPLDVLRAIDADLDLRFETVKLGDAAPLGPLQVRATISDSVLKADLVEFTAGAGQSLGVKATVDGARSAWSMRINGAGIDFGEVLARFNRKEIVTGGSTDLTLQLAGHGKSLGALLGSLTGDAQIKVGSYRINNFAVPLDRGTIIQMFGLSNPFVKEDPHTDVRCLTARVPIKNGTISSDRNVATETTRYNTIMSGTLNLRTEQLDLALTPVVHGKVKTIVHLRGTLAEPVVEVNAIREIAKSAASIGATVATMGGWWMAETLLRKAASDPSPCATALAR